MSNVTLSEKINKIRQLPDSDNKEAVVQEIEALEIFTDDERSSIFGNSSIIWVLKNFTVRELKNKAKKALMKPDVKLGDVILYGPLRAQKAVVLEVTGKDSDRLTIIFKEEDHFGVREGVSAYDVELSGSNIDITQFLEFIK